MKNRLLLVVLAVSMAGFCSCAHYLYDRESCEEYERGAAQAARDIAQGRYVRLGNTGIFRESTKEVRRELEARHGIGYRMDRDQTSDYVKGYNAVVHAAAQQRFGNDYYDNIVQDVFSDSGAQFGPLLKRS